jgi:hypothetical protein
MLYSQRTLKVLSGDISVQEDLDVRSQNGARFWYYGKVQFDVQNVHNMENKHWNSVWNCTQDPLYVTVLIFNK